MADPNPRPRGGFRCHHCAGPLSKDMEASDWNVSPLIRDSFSMVNPLASASLPASLAIARVLFVRHLEAVVLGRVVFGVRSRLVRFRSLSDFFFFDCFGVARFSDRFGCGRYGQRFLWIQPCDADCPEMGKRANVVAFPYWCTSSDSVLLSLCRIGRWCGTCSSTTCIFILSCNCVLPIASFSLSR
ncbi:hypothetical protein EUGRSUZ_A02080 [Eucalyptus grandis]|uniref:Uncharacterized protein n=2 Tax=Eucalyptus grandis TaxID=71139 RepID=A0ACC3M568_EUCGR|nr:hypothetical protein EUGRSUZ_A02080 [Eucalyptus grandis]